MQSLELFLSLSLFRPGCKDHNLISVQVFWFGLFCSSCQHAKQKVHTQVVKTSGSYCLLWSSVLFIYNFVTLVSHSHGSVIASSPACVSKHHRKTHLQEHRQRPVLTDYSRRYVSISMQRHPHEGTVSPLGISKELNEWNTDEWQGPLQKANCLCHSQRSWESLTDVNFKPFGL